MRDTAKVNKNAVFYSVEEFYYSVYMLHIFVKEVSTLISVIMLLLFCCFSGSVMCC